MLMRWGCEQADKDNLPVYLESSSVGLPLYQRFGFNELQRKILDLTKYGGHGEDYNFAMVRSPQTSAA